MATSCELQEATYQGSNVPVVDREKGYIRGAKILGRFSPNGGGREYSDKALREAAIRYEGLGVNLNHPDRSTPSKERQVQEGIGWLENVNVREDGVYGDIGILKEDPMAGKLFEAAERRPDRFGLSHNAKGGTSVRNGKTIVESITSVRSVDIVQNPATNKSLFESKDPEMAEKHTLKSLIESLPAKSKQRTVLTVLMEDVGLPMVAPDMPVDMTMTPAEGEAVPTADEAAKAAFEAVILAIFRDDTITWKETQTKIKEAVDAVAKMSGGDPASVTTEEPPAEEEPAMESLQEQVEESNKRIALLESTLADKDATLAARDLLESKGITVKPERLATLKKIDDQAARKDLLESWAKADGPKPKLPVPRPAASPPANGNLMESLPAGYKPPATAKDMAAAYR